MFVMARVAGQRVGQRNAEKRENHGDC
jgi:hypothetical protein